MIKKKQNKKKIQAQGGKGKHSWRETVDQGNLQ